MKKKRKKGNLLINIFLVLILLTGLSLLLYPTFSEFWNSTRQSKAIAEYAKKVSAMDQEEYERFWMLAGEYNRTLEDRTTFYALDDAQREVYEGLLNISGNGIMAYIEIPKIDCYLPVYHGVDETVLQVGAGHLEWSSLPVGGENTHCVISGHRGLPSAKLFTDLDKLEEGDLFFLTVLDEKLAYEVDQIEVVLPEEVENLGVEEGKDYVTLVTCTPYGINTHRILVRGHRTAYTEPDDEEENFGGEIIITKNVTKEFWRMVLMVFGGLIFLILLLLVLFRKKK